MLGFFKSKQSSDHKSKTNNISLIQVTKSENSNQTTSDTNNTVRKSSNANSSTKSTEINSNGNVTQPTGSNIKHSIFSFSKKDQKYIKKQLQQQSNQLPLGTENHVRKEDRKKPPTISSVFSMIIENTSDENATPSEHELQIFDPEPALDETDTFNHITVIFFFKF